MSINRVMVVGAGIMGSGIAQTCIEHGVSTLLVDVSKEVADKGAANIAHFLQRKIEKGKIKEEDREAALKLLQTSGSYEDGKDVDVVVEGERKGDFDFVVDFKDVKKYIKAICNELDHRLLIPVYNNLIDFKDFNKKTDSIFSLKEKDTVFFKIEGKGYSIPSVDCVFLPLPYTSAEELAMFFAKSLTKKLTENYDSLVYISVCVNEGIGQGAEYRNEIE